MQTMIILSSRQCHRFSTYQNYSDIRRLIYSHSLIIIETHLKDTLLDIIAE